MSRALQIIQQEAKETTKGVLRALGNPDVNAVLEYAPEEFVAAYRAGQEAHWDPEMHGDADWVPIYDDDGETWRKCAYSTEFRTEEGKVIEEVHEVDSDGNHDYSDEAEIGTEEWRQMHKTYYADAPKEWNAYFQWVVQSGEDPLDEIFIPTEKVQHEWIGGFTERPDGSLQFFAVRRLGQEPPAQMIQDLAQVPQDVKNYLLLKDDGSTEVTIDDVKQEGGKQDKQGRWTIKFTIGQDKQPANTADLIRQKAQEWLDQEPVAEGISPQNWIRMKS
jgi:hypothetical protein